ncbi:phage virion morphogenesis protein [Janthinobacterium sp. BJB426]|uniref:phage virion morphogenesis protein n=1 Tax=Janthinobacterium sp. BJB426 TaxID=2048010 RepID=UPI001F266F70|nr:phage virion morphogenesis protein [Janthinobacterium sp. BJB426]
MFAKIHTAKHLKVKATTDQIEVGFFGWVARVAHMHQFGQQDRVAKKDRCTSTRSGRCWA